MLGNDKNSVIVNYLFTKLVFVLKLLGLNGYLKGYLKSRINKLLKKIIINFLLANADLLKISFIFFDTTYLQKSIP